MLPPNIKVRLALFLLLATLLVASAGLKRDDAAASVAPAPVAGQGRENLALKHSFSGKAPQGKWSVAAIPDLAQATDTTTPVVRRFSRCAIVVQCENKSFDQLTSCARVPSSPTMRLSPESPNFIC